MEEMGNQQWNAKIEQLLLDYKFKCLSFKTMHEYATQRIAFNNLIINILTIVLTAAIATINAVVVNRNNEILSIIASAVLYLISVVKSLQGYLNYEVSGEKHKTSSVKYNTLHTMIQNILALDVSHRQDVKTFLLWLTKEYNDLYNNSLDIPQHIVNRYKKEAKCSSATLFSIPEEKTEEIDVEKALPEKEEPVRRIPVFAENSWNRYVADKFTADNQK